MSEAMVAQFSASHIMPRKKSILPVQRYGPNGSFDAVVVDLDTTVSQEDTEAIPVFGDIGKHFAERRLTSDMGTILREPTSHVGDYRLIQDTEQNE